jgi:hypothetical protein
MSRPSGSSLITPSMPPSAVRPTRWPALAPRAAVAHGGEQVDHHLLEELGRAPGHAIEKGRPQLVDDLVVGGLQALLRSGRGRELLQGNDIGRRPGTIAAGPGALPELQELGEVHQHLVVDPLRVAPQDLQAAGRRLEVAAPGHLQEPRLAEIGLGPVDTVGEDRLPAARQPLASLLPAQPEAIGQRLGAVPDADLALGRHLQHRPHQCLVVRDRHFSFRHCMVRS